MAETTMAIFTVLQCFCLLGTVALIKGQESTIEKRVEALEKQGAEQSRLVTLLLQRLDRQEGKLKSQSQMLDKQQSLLNRQEIQLQTQSQTLEKQQTLLQQYVGYSERLTFMLRGQNVRIKNHEKALQKMRISQRQPASSSAGSLNDADMANLSRKSLSSSMNLAAATQNGKAETARWMTKSKDITPQRAAKKDSENAKTKRFVVEGEGPVAFHAVIDSGEVAHIGINQNLVFNVVLENLGGGYHNQHGIFIAPVNGVYIFSVSVMSWLNDHPEFQAALKKDGVALARAFGHGDNGRHDQGSVTVVTQLSQGNEVWVALEGITDDSIYGSRYTTFMGCLVYSL